MPHLYSCEILIVEDDIDIREALREVLLGYGFTVATANNGQEGLDYLRASRQAKTPPLLVLLDLMMPIMGGREMLDILLLEEGINQVPVFIISAAASAANSMGAVGFLRKPIDIDELLELAEKHSGRSRKRHR
ncbi:MAG: response regulator [Bdellovibrionota bacterium]